MNGGACTDGVNSYTCTYATGYEGTICVTPAPAPEPTVVPPAPATSGVHAFACARFLGVLATIAAVIVFKLQS